MDVQTLTRTTSDDGFKAKALEAFYPFIGKPVNNAAKQEFEKALTLRMNAKDASVIEYQSGELRCTVTLMNGQKRVVSFGSVRVFA